MGLALTPHSGLVHAVPGEGQGEERSKEKAEKDFLYASVCQQM